MPGRAYEQIYEAALDQYGCITTARAAALGIERHTLLMMERRGQLERLTRGVYRVVAIPQTPLTAYAAATLWPQTGGAVLSHETALDLHGVSDVNPGRIHITIPSAHGRIRRATPRVYAVHVADLAPTETTTHEGLPVTTLERTIRDCATTHVGLYLLEQAIKAGRRVGKLSGPVADALAAMVLTGGWIADDPAADGDHETGVWTEGRRRTRAHDGPKRLLPLE